MADSEEKEPFVKSEILTEAALIINAGTGTSIFRAQSVCNCGRDNNRT